jgi:ribosome-binding protein aMBF1 (putative translation factor)
LATSTPIDIRFSDIRPTDPSLAIVRGSIYTARHKKLVRILRSLRTEAGVTQTQLAQRLRRPQSFVSAYEAGQRRLDLIDVEQIAKALGTTLTAVVEQYSRSK